MFAQAHYPELLTPEELDAYLEEGWFRMGQTIFTTSFLNFNNQLYRAIWLRTVLEDFQIGKTLQKLLKLNAHFKVEIKQASITPEKDVLFAKYKQSIDFEPSESLIQLLYGEVEHNIFNTKEINLYDEDKLIATGFFDIGKEGAAGISCFYDPAYKKNSLGKYLIFQKMLYCKNQKLQYFYFGYFAPGYPAFDYKLDIGKSSLEYLDVSTQRWQSMNSFDIMAGSIKEITEKLTTLKQQLESLGIENHLLSYKYFDANLMRNLFGYELFDYPQFIYCFEFIPESINPIIVYDIRDGQYHLIKCMSIGISNEHNDHTKEYSAHLLKTKQVIFSTYDAREMVTMIAAAFHVYNM